MLPLTKLAFSVKMKKGKFMEYTRDIIWNLNNTKIFCTDYIHYIQSEELNLYEPDIVKARNLYRKIEFFRKNITLHKHYSLEIQFIINGNLKIFTNDKEYTVDKGNIIIIPSGVNHCCFNLSNNFERCSFLFSLKNLTDKIGQEFQFLDHLASYDKLGIFPMNEQDIYILQHINAYMSEAPSFYNTHITQSLLTILLFRLIQKVLPEQAQDYNYDNTLDSQAQRKSKIEHFLYSVRDKNPSLKDVAIYLGLSSRQTARIISDYFQMPFSKLVVKIKMEEAKYLIENTDLNINIISSSLGYTSYFTFYKTYKKYYGHAPSKKIPKNEKAGE